MSKSGPNNDDNPSLKELQRIRNLLMLLLMKQGATSDELDIAVRMGAGNIRALLPARKLKKVVGK